MRLRNIAPSARTILSAGTIVLALVFSGCSSASPRFGRREPAPPRTPVQPPDSAPAASASASARGAELATPFNRHAFLVAVMTKMGIPYDDGGEDSSGMDCSGFIQSVYREAAGIGVPRTSQEQYETGEPVDDDDLRFGDLVFFNTTGRVPSHVGIYVGDGIFAHASVSMGVTVSFLSQEYYRERYVGARRLKR